MTACCCIDVESTCDVLRTTFVKKSRAAHFCVECWRCIPPGSPYLKEVVRGYDDEKIKEFKTCMLCYRVREDRMPCGFEWGGVWSDIGECLREYGDDDDAAWLDPPDFPIKGLWP